MKIKKLFLFIAGAIIFTVILVAVSGEPQKPPEEPFLPSPEEQSLEEEKKAEEKQESPSESPEELPEEQQETDTYLVTKVIDGDTITIEEG
jgi:hypothetical protein